MKKKTAIILSMSLCLGSGASAAEFKVADGGQNVEVSEVLESNDSAVLMVVKNGDPLDVGKLVTIRTETPKDGTAVWSFGMPEKIDGDLSDGVYDSYIKQNGKTFKTDSFVYASVESRKRVSGELSGDTAAGDFSVDDLMGVFGKAENKYALEVFGFYMDGYNSADSDKKYIAGGTLEIAKKGNAYETAKTFNLMTAVDAINAGKPAEAYLKKANPVFEGTSFADIDDKNLIDWICSIVGANKYNSAAELESMNKTANMLYIINNSRVNYIGSNIDKYASELGITSNSYYITYLNASNRENINTNLVTALGNNPAKTATELTEAIKNAISAAGTPGGGTSSGGGGGKSSISSGVALTVPTGDRAAGFADMSAAKWAEDAVNAMVEAGVVAGDENGNFRPNDMIKREEFVKMLVLATGNYDANAECDFADTSKSDWHYSYIASAYQKGLAMGVSDDLFGVGMALTRQDMALLCRRAMNTLEKKHEAVVFGDDAEISEYAKEAVYELYRAGGISGMGDNTFSPLTQATRAQAATIIYNLFLK